MKVTARTRVSTFKLDIENRNGWYWIGGIALHNAPVTNFSSLLRGDCVTQLPLERGPENFWIVDRVEHSPIHGPVVIMLNGSRLYAGNLKSPALYFQCKISDLPHVEEKWKK